MKKVIFLAVVFFASTALLAQMLKIADTPNFKMPDRGAQTCAAQTDCNAGYYCQKLQYNPPSVPCGWNAASNTCQLKFAPGAFCICPAICSIVCPYGYHALTPGQPGYVPVFGGFKCSPNPNPLVAPSPSVR